MFERGAQTRVALPCALLLTLTLLAPRSGVSQTAAEMRARVVNARRIAKIARDSTDTLRHVHGRDIPPDSMSAGALILRFDKEEVPPRLLKLLDGAVHQAWASADSQFGEASAAAVNGTSIWVDRTSHRFLWDRFVENVQLELSGPGGGGRSTGTAMPITQQKLADEILDLVGTSATRAVPTNIVTWTGYWTPARTASDETWKQVALDLATSNSSATRACYAGAIQSCESALGLTELKDSLTEWYSPDGWRVLVESYAAPKDLLAMEIRRDCVEKRIAATCERLARTRPILLPLNMTSRATVLGLAIERGGRQAFARLIRSKGTPIQILAATAGISADSLVGEWRLRSLAQLPSSTRPSAGEATAMLAWTIIFGFAATRRRP